VVLRGRRSPSLGRRGVAVSGRRVALGNCDVGLFGIRELLG
jgi:hypothetical protein